MERDAMMINGVLASGMVRVDRRQEDSVRGRAVVTAATVSVDGETSSVSSTARAIAAEGAPIDAGKIAAIRQAIAEGRYPVDPQKIAERMIALDLGR